MATLQEAEELTTYQIRLSSVQQGLTTFKKARRPTHVVAARHALMLVGICRSALR